jgi:hypothetical protein
VRTAFPTTKKTPAACHLPRLHDYDCDSTAAALSKSNQRLWRNASPPGRGRDAIWGARRPNYIHGHFGGIFFAPQVPLAPRCTPVVISTKLTSRLSLAPCCAGQPSFGHIQAAPRRALLLLDSIRRRSSQAKITDLTTVRSAGLLIKL